MPGLLPSSFSLSGNRPFEAQVAEEIGYVAQLMLGTQRRVWRVATIQAFVEPPVRLRQTAFLLNSYGRPLAYASWAYLSKETERAFLNNPSYVPELEEWNEGASLWIMDFVAPAGGTHQLAGLLKRKLSNHMFVNWRRSGRPLQHIKMRPRHSNV